MHKEAENFNKLTSKELLRANVYVERQEKISVNDVVDEYDLIDPSHAENLAKSMMGKRGQITPINVRARLDGDKIVYDLIDGFHRHAGKKIIQSKTGELQPMHAIVLYGCNDEELFDLRILAVNSVKKVKFARMAIWMIRSLEETTWQNKGIKKHIDSKEITLSQIFTLAQNNSSGKKFGLSESEANELKKWAKEKASLWRKSLPSLMQDMRTVELSAPDLVQRVRQGGGGGRGILTAARLKAIADNLPSEWELQRRFADVAVAENILATDLDYLIWVYHVSEEAGDKETIEKIFKRPELLLDPQKPEIVISEPPKHEEVISTSPAPWEKPESTPNEPQNIRRFRSVPLKKENPNIYNDQTRERKQFIDEFDERTILRKHKMPQLYKAVVESILCNNEEELVVLNLSAGELTLNLKHSRLSLGDNTIQLSISERDLMLALSIFEGVSITEEMLSILSLNERHFNINVRKIIPILQTKIAHLSYEAAKELRYDENRYSWLAE